jgi:type I restriction enzyme S subunit
VTSPGWSEATLGEVAETRLGKMLSKKARSGNGSRPYLRNKNVQWARIELDDLLEMDFTDAELERFRVEPGDLLVCEGGEVGRAAIWRGQLDWIGYQKALHRVRPLGGMASEYLLYLFMWLGQTNAFDAHVTGSTIKHLPQEDLRLLRVPLPALNEQRRIVAAIEEHLSRLDAADASLAAALRRLDALLVQVSVTAFRGDWPRQPFVEVASVASNLVDPSRYPDLPHIAPNHIERATGRLLPYKTVAEDGVKSQKHLFRPGQIIYSKIRPYLAKATLVEFEGLCSADTYPIDTELEPRFLLRWMLTPEFTELAVGQQGRSVLPKINREQLSRLPVPVPPLSEQRRIVQEVEERLSRIDAMRASIERAQKRSKALRAAILERAFRGELVPQDPSDEPAEALLARIRAERDWAAVPSGRGRKRE